jgi:hypothetical protein
MSNKKEVLSKSEIAIISAGLAGLVGAAGGSYYSKYKNKKEYEKLNKGLDNTIEGLDIYQRNARKKENFLKEKLEEEKRLKAENTYKTMKEFFNESRQKVEDKKDKSLKAENTYKNMKEFFNESRQKVEDKSLKAEKKNKTKI